MSTHTHTNHWLQEKVLFCIFFKLREIINGIAVYDENGGEVGYSKNAAYKGIMQVCASRIAMAAPGMCKLNIVC